jgi:hypothetical protein
MFVDQVKSTVQVGDVVVTIRKLSARSLDSARQAKSMESMAQIRALGGDIFKAMREAENHRERIAADPNAQAEARYSSYDREAVIRSGVESWTDPRTVDKGLETMDEETAELLSRAILDLSLPPIDKAAQEAAEGKG